MNKYKEALERLERDFNLYNLSPADMDLMYEIVALHTPMEPVDAPEAHIHSKYCPHGECGGYVGYEGLPWKQRDICLGCGQYIKWTEEENDQ